MCVFFAFLYEVVINRENIDAKQIIEPMIIPIKYIIPNFVIK